MYPFTAIIIIIVLSVSLRIIVIDFPIKSAQKFGLYESKCSGSNEEGYIHDSHHTSTWLNSKAICLQITICNNIQGRENQHYTAADIRHTHTHTYHSRLEMILLRMFISSLGLTSMSWNKRKCLRQPVFIVCLCVYIYEYLFV